MQSKPKKDSLIIVRLPGELKQKATETATESGTTVSELIRSLLEKRKSVKLT